MPSAEMLRALAERWATAKAAERANAQLYIVELCAALGVEAPRPAGSGYEFELPLKLIARDGTEAQGFVDCYKAGHFVLEAKDYEEGRSADVLLRKAFGQARMYASHDPSGTAPPYLLVLDVGKTLLVWDRWAGTFGGYAAARRVDLARLYERPEDAALLVDIWTNPTARNPRLKSQAVTKDIAAHLAELAASLEDRGFDQERVARFLMRCVFTMFSEDVGLLPDEPFRRLLDEVAVPTPDEFAGAAEDLWRAMDEGRRFGFRKLLRFNGHFFKDAEALPLSRADLAILLEAARADWSKVEPTIFGTLSRVRWTPRSVTASGPSIRRQSSSSASSGPPSRSRFVTDGPLCRRKCCSFASRRSREIVRRPSSAYSTFISGSAHSRSSIPPVEAGTSST